MFCFRLTVRVERWWHGKQMVPRMGVLESLYTASALSQAWRPTGIMI
jgi:hypothetical protein